MTPADDVGVRFVTDAAVDLPPGLESDPRVAVVDGTVVVGGARFAGDQAEFWSRLRAGEPVSSSPPGVAALAEAYGTARRVVAVHVSREASATVSHAQEAAVQVPSVVDVVDSRSLSVGAGLLVMELVHADAGDPAALARTLPSRLHTFALVQDTTTLQRSDRAGLLPRDGLTRHRPLLLALRGRAVALGQVKDRARGVDRLAAHGRDAAGGRIRAWAIGHADAGDTDAVAGRLAKAFGQPASFQVPLDPIVGVHLGPDSVVVGVLS